MKKPAVVALLLAGAVVLGATVLREPVARAAQLFDVTIVGPLDRSGNVKVSQQGTADVDITNSSLAVEPAPPITGGGGEAFIAGGNADPFVPPSPVTATALSIRMSNEVVVIRFRHKRNLVAAFRGPGALGNSPIVVALARPIRFDAIDCGGTSGSFCTVGWVGTDPD